jgi:hypothetical protein
MPAPPSTAPSTLAPPSERVDTTPAVRRLSAALARFAGALVLVWLAVWWVVPAHSFSGPVLYVVDGRDGHGLHLGDLPAALFLVAAFWLAWPVRRDRAPSHATADALRVAAVGALGALSVWWVVPEHEWTGPTIFELLGRRHGVHLLDPLVAVFLGLALLVGRRWWRPVTAGVLVSFALWWAKGSHPSFDGPVILELPRGHVVHRSDPLALLYLAAAAVIGVPWVRRRWDRWQRERRARPLLTSDRPGARRLA